MIVSDKVFSTMVDKLEKLQGMEKKYQAKIRYRDTKIEKLKTELAKYSTLKEFENAEKDQLHLTKKQRMKLKKIELEMYRKNLKEGK